MILYIDLETYSSVDLRKTGVYPYFESDDFEIMLIGYAVNDGPVEVLDLTDEEALGLSRLQILGLANKADKVVAHNATFERLALKAMGLPIPAKSYFCTMVKAAACGLPMGLAGAGEALGLDVQKDAAGKALIRYFCKPCKPTKTNGGRLRNEPEDAPEKWEAFKDYLIDDVRTTRELYKALECYQDHDAEDYALDQKINDTGVKLDADLIEKAVELDRQIVHRLTVEARKLTGLDNPKSPAQLAAWLTDQTGEKIINLKAETVKDMLATATGDVKKALTFRLKTSNTSVKKYSAALSYACGDGRARGLFQFYGAGRTGRWAGRGVQLQNMPRNYMNTLNEARELLKAGDFETLDFLYEDLQKVLKELTRTMLTPSSKNNKLLVADYSAIEARVIAWLAGESWRLEVFNTHGLIYEASASLMFGVPIEEVTKGSDYRAKGKVAELALGYQGGWRALQTMGGEKMGLDETEMRAIVTRWRKANPAIKKYWHRLESAAFRALKNPRTRVKVGAVSFIYTRKALLCRLPSGRDLVYQTPEIYAGTYGEAIRYKGLNQTSNRYDWLDLYGGKIVENVVQAVARDLLAYALRNVDAAGFKIVMHVHDEIVVDRDEQFIAGDYKKMLKEMTKKPDWAEGLPLDADGFITDFFKKD